MKNGLVTRRSFIKTGLIFVPTVAILRPRLALAADPVDPDRLIYGGSWEGKVGVEGGIPNYTTIADTIAPYSGSSATIINALNAAGNDEVVQLEAGTYNLSSAIDFTKSRVVLRGAVDGNGNPATNLVFSAGSEAIIRMWATSWDLSSSSAFTIRTVSSGVARGSTQFTLASAPTSLVVGQIMWIGNNTPGGGGADLWASDGTNRSSYQQQVRVTNIAGSVVDFSPALNADYLTGTTRIGYRTLGSSLRRSGCENLNVTRAGASGHFWKFQVTDECWLKNCKSFDVPSTIYHVYNYGNFRLEIRHCDFSHMSDLTNSTYCCLAQQSTGFLMIDNHFHDAPNIMPMRALNGSAFAYNYVNDLPYSPNSQLSQIVFYHGSHSSYNLMEGNWLASSYHDEDGTSINTTYLRNRMRGYDDTGPKSANTNCIIVARFHDNVTMAGNILGENGVSKHDTVLDTWDRDVEGDDGDSNDGPWNIYDVESEQVASFDRFKNYNTVDDAIPAGEALAGGDSLATSYLFSSRPSFAHYWPLFDPDNPSRASVSGTSSAADNLAAAYRPANSGADPIWADAPLGAPVRRQGLRGIRLK